MKNFAIKLFLFLCALVFIIESAVFFMLRLGRLSPEAVIIFYQAYLQTQRGQDIVLGLAIGSLIGGLIFLYLDFRLRAQPDFITVKDKTGILQIPLEAIRDFVNQTLCILDEYSFMSDLTTVVQKKGKGIYINILFICAGTGPIRQEINRLKKALREQIVRVFELAHLKIDFQIKGIFVEQKKEKIISQQEQKEGERPVSKEDGPQQKETGQDNENIIEDGFRKEEPHKVMPWQR